MTRTLLGAPAMTRTLLGAPAMRRAFAALVAAALPTLACATAVAQPSAPGTPTVIDGPSAAITNQASPGVSIARDGSGGLVYLKSVQGTAHVFVSQLVQGSFQHPVQVDSSLAGASSQPVIAAGNGGLLLVGFINGGQLYVVDGNAAGQFGAPIDLAGGAVNPAISITNFGKAYLAFAVADGGGHDVRTAYYYNGQWQLEAPPLNATPADNAGIGTGRPDVAAAGDGIAIVAWGERGSDGQEHIYTRRVWGTAASVVYEQADTAAPSGCTESSADEPVVGSGGDSSFAPVAFHAILVCNSQQQSRVLVNRLQGSVYDGVAEADGLGANPTEGATDPQIAVAEFGQGWITSERSTSDAVFAASLGQNGTFTGSGGTVNTLSASALPRPVPAITGLHANLIAWLQQPAPAPGGEVRLRSAPDGSTLEPEIVVSSPAQGPIDPAVGPAAAGDTSGDAAIAWLQGQSGAMQLMVGQLYVPPGGFSTPEPFAYATTSQPVLTWTRPRGWGPITYALTIDGAQVGQTTATSARPPAPLPDGPHSWGVTATNPAGQQSSASSAIVFVDTVAPTGKLKLRSHGVAGAKLHPVVKYGDLPPAGEPIADASGVAKVTIRWGDRDVLHVRIGSHRVSHVYRRAGTYQVILTIVDRAGNRTRVVELIKIAKAKHKHKKKVRGRHH
jgi:hypothetical protein